MLREMFSPIGAPREDQTVDYFDDLKFYIDNDNEILSKIMFPAILKHKENIGDAKSYKIYLKPMSKCVEQYCKKFNIESPEKIFPKGKIIEFAKMFAQVQEQFIKDGAYE